MKHPPGSTVPPAPTIREQVCQHGSPHDDRDIARNAPSDSEQSRSIGRFYPFRSDGRSDRMLPLFHSVFLQLPKEFHKSDYRLLQLPFVSRRPPFPTKQSVVHVSVVHMSDIRKRLLLYHKSWFFSTIKHKKSRANAQRHPCPCGCVTPVPCYRISVTALQGICGCVYLHGND